MGCNRPRARASLFVGVAVAAATLASVPVVWAAPPGNDSIYAAPLLTIPSVAQRTITEATTDPATDPEGCASLGQTVWYRIRTSTTRILQLDTTGSTFDSSVEVFRGTPGSLEVVACPSVVSRALEFTATQGVTYYVRVGTCCFSPAPVAGTAVLRVHGRWKITPTVQLATTNAGLASGRAQISGTEMCNRAMNIELYATVSQRNDAVVARGVGATYLPCEPRRRQWSMAINSETGYAFQPGAAVVTLSWNVCDQFRCVSSTAEYVVNLGAAPNAEDT